MGMYKAGRPIKYYPLSGSGKCPPEKAGEYRIRNSANKIVYIGETCNLKRRMNEHIKSGKLNINFNYSFEYKIADARSSSYSRRQHEKEKIKQHNPILNCSKGGEGRIAKRKK